MNKQWIYKNPEPSRIRDISSLLGVSPTLAALLINRNITSIQDAELFMNPDLSKLHNPFLLPNIEKAVVRVRESMARKEKILVYGDRDADGVTSVAVLVRTLSALGADVVWAVPSDEGFGLHKSILEKFAQQNVKLVITVDCGTSAVEEIDFANTLGMDVIVTDHHLPPEILPRAFAIVNPNLKDSTYPMKDLAGCLTAFKFAYALMFSFNRTFNQEYVIFDLETTGLKSPPDEIVEIGAVCLRNFVPIKTFHTMVRPTIPISQGAMAVNGITNEMVADAPGIQEVLPALLEFIGDRTMVAHNAKFDLDFLQFAMKKHLNRDFMNPCIDTLARSRENFSFRSHALGSLAKELHIDMTQAHRSMADCMATAGLFQRIEEHADPRLRYFLEDQLDLVCLGTIADVVPLIGENRTVVKHGLPCLSKTRKVGLKKLIEMTVVRGNNRSGANDRSPLPQMPLTSKDIGWSVTPLINAAGRFSKAHLAVQLLLTQDEQEAFDLVQQLIRLNRDRKNLQKTNVEKFLKLAQTQCNLESDPILFVAAEGLEHGVTGIVANQLMREFQKPVVLLIKEENEFNGSARSIHGFNVVEAFHECKDLLIRYGGHPAAAGLTVSSDCVELLRTRLKKIAQEKITPESLTPQITIDMNLDFNDITTQLLKEISGLEPFGEGNPPPVFSVKGVYLAEHSLVGPQKNHLRLQISDQKKALPGIGWGMSAIAPKLKKGDSLDLVFQLEMNTWENREYPQLVLFDINTLNN